MCIFRLNVESMFKSSVSNPVSNGYLKTKYLCSCELLVLAELDVYW